MAEEEFTKAEEKQINRLRDLDLLFARTLKHLVAADDHSRNNRLTEALAEWEGAQANGIAILAMRAVQKSKK